jgi:VanZ family protein
MTALKQVGPFVAYAAYIFFSGSSHDSGPPAGLSDKAAHFIAFGLMVPVAVYAVTYFAERLSYPVRVAVAVGAASGVGALLELVQFFLPWRTAEFLDWFADTCGALLVGAALLALRAAVPRVRRE